MRRRGLKGGILDTEGFVFLDIIFGKGGVKAAELDLLAESWSWSWRGRSHPWGRGG